MQSDINDNKFMFYGKLDENIRTRLTFEEYKNINNMNVEEFMDVMLHLNEYYKLENKIEIFLNTVQILDLDDEVMASKLSDMRYFKE